jgi:TPR repeat protein
MYVRMYNLAVMYQFGQGVPVNYKQSIYWFMMAAEQGHTSSQHSLGVIYAEGRGVPRDLLQAYVWSSLAASQGHEGGQTNRDVLERAMTPEQVAEAQRLARELMQDGESRI